MESKEIETKEKEPTEKETKEKEMTETELAELIEIMSKQDKSSLEFLSMIVRAFDGRAIDSDDVITRLINVKNLMERSRYPTYPQVGLQVYLRLVAHYAPEAEPCKEWADTLSHALIAYKGENWKAYVEMAKGQQLAAQQEFYLGPRAQDPQAQAQATKRRWPWSREPKPEQEFKSQ